MMFDFSSALFMYKLGFTVELLVAEFIFAINLRRRARFPLRLSLCVVGLFAVSFLMPIIAYNAWWTSFMFMAIFAASLCAMKLCFKECWQNIFFCGLAAYTVQHVAFVIFNSVNDVFSVFFGISGEANMYLEQYADATAGESAATAVIYALSFFMVYMIAHYAYTEKINPDEMQKLGRVRFIILAGIIIITDNLFNALSLYNTEPDMLSYWIERGYNVITCLLALQLQFSQLNEKEIQSELSTVRRILHEERKQYSAIKQNLDIVNVKCHDMKYRLQAMRDGKMHLAKEEISEAERVAAVYESVVETGNDTLDLILTEKSFQCYDKGIKITCIADGASMDFMTPSDMYSLFGNALDNAIEAVSVLDEAKRSIGFSVKRVGNFVSVHVENMFGGKLRMKNSLPETTKSNTNYHGYGMLSMKYLTEKYGGTLAVDICGNVFNLNILFPRRGRRGRENDG